jgi:hypothetical protein
VEDSFLLGCDVASRQMFGTDNPVIQCHRRTGSSVLPVVLGMPCYSFILLLFFVVVVVVAGSMLG